MVATKRVQWIVPLAYSLLLLIIPFIMIYLGYTESRESQFLISRYAYLTNMAARVEARVNTAFQVVYNSRRRDDTFKPVDIDPEVFQTNRAYDDLETKKHLGQNSLGIQASAIKMYLGDEVSEDDKLIRIDRTRVKMVVASNDPKIPALVVPANTSTLLGELDSSGRFDDVILFDNDRASVYQQNPERGRIESLDDLVGTNVDEASTQEQLLADDLSTMIVRFQGEDYLKFEQPVVFKGETGVWTLAGLISKHRFEATRLEFPTTELVSFLFFMALLMLVAPIVRLRYVGPFDSVHRHDLWIQFSLGCFTVTLVSLFLMHWEYSEEQIERLDETIDTLGTELNRLLVGEIHAQVATLQRVTPAMKQASWNATTQAKEMENPGAPSQLDMKQRKHLVCTQGNPLTCRDIRANVANRLAPTALFDESAGIGGADTYPLYRMLYLMDEDGNQRVKWSSSKVVTKPGNFADRPYFARVNPHPDTLKNLFRFSTPESSETPELESDPFFMQVILSRTTGEKSTVVSQGVKRCTEGDKSPGCVVVLSAGLRAMESVVPFGFGYAIIDETGAILFHSGEPKVAEFNLFDEVADGNALRTVIKARSKRKVTDEYHSAEHRFQVRPVGIDGPNWHLVVFYNADLYEIFRLEAAAAAFVVWVAWFSLMLGFAGLFMLAKTLWGRDQINRLIDIPNPSVLHGLMMVYIISLSLYVIVDWSLAIAGVFILLLWIRHHTLNLHNETWGTTSIRVGVLIAVMTVFVLSLTSVPIVGFYREAKSLSVGFVASAQILNERDGRQTQREKVRAWKNTTQLSEVDTEAVEQAFEADRVRNVDTSAWLEDPYLKFWQAFGIVQDRDDLAALDCGGQAICWVLSLLPGYGEESRMIRPSYHFSLQPKASEIEALGGSGHWSFQSIIIAIAGIFSLAGVIWFWSGKLFGFQISNFVREASILAPIRGTRLHQIIFGMPDRAQEIIQHYVGSERMFYVDFRAATVKPSVTALMRGRESLQDVVVVDHFDDLLSDPEMMRIRVELLEHLLHQTNVSLFVLSTVDTLNYMNQRLMYDADVDQRLVSRLGVALSALIRQYYQEAVPQDPPPNASDARRWLYDECRNPSLSVIFDLINQDEALDTYDEQQLTRLLLARANPIYQRMWDACTHVEKFTLKELAFDRPVNPNNWDAARRLKQRGYLRRDPLHRIFNVSFKQYIQNIAPTEDMDSWKSELPSTWTRIRVPALVLIVTGAIFIAATQPSVFNSIFAWVAAASAALPLLIRFMGTWMSGMNQKAR